MLGKLLMLLVFLTCFAAQVRAENVIRAYVGANGIWYEDEVRPSDFEATGNVRASLSPHISLVGGAFYGVEHSYLRGSAGVRLTATDVNDPNFSVGVGLQYHASSEPAVRPEGFAPDVSIGWRPRPETWPAIIFVGQGAYLTEVDEMFFVLGVRYDLGSFGSVR